MTGLARSRKTVRSSIKNALDNAYDSMYGVDTTTPPSVAITRDAIYTDCRLCGSMLFPLNYRYLKPLKIQKDDIAVDVGCGLGRIVCCMARCRMRHCIGVEVSKELAARAKENAERLRRRKTSIEIVVADAANYNYSESTVVVLFNPFGSDTMRATLGRIKMSWQVNPRNLRLLYMYPAHEHPAQLAEFERLDWLICYARKRTAGCKTIGTYWRPSGR